MFQLLAEIKTAIIQWLKRLWFEAKLKARLDMIEIDNRIAAELELEKQNKPIYIEHPVNPELQTGASKDLGGAMELKAPWYNPDDRVEP